MKKFSSIILALALMLMTTTAFAGEIFIRNAWYGRPGINNEYIRLTTTSNPNYNRFTNGRFAYTICVPREFTIGKSPANGDGCIFNDEYGSEFIVSGMHNYGLTLTDRFNQAVARHPNAVTKLRGDDWYVISYLEDGNIVYEKHFVNADYINSWYFKYPQWLGDRYNPKCEDIEPTFIPGWKTGHRILG